MKSKTKNIDPLKELVKKHGILIPPEEFSSRLMNAVVTRYKFNYSKQYRKQERLGKWIIAVLVTCSMLIFINLRPSVVVLEIVFPIFSLSIGLAILLFMFKKLGRNSYRH